MPLQGRKLNNKTIVRISKVDREEMEFELKWLQVALCGI
jgi:hypothetical protein